MGTIRFVWRLILGFVPLTAMLAGGASSIAQAQTASPPNAGAVHVVTYIDLAPISVDKAIAAMSRYRKAAMGEAGNAGVSILQEIGRRDRVAIVEVWNDQKAADGHAGSASTSRLESELKPLRIAPNDVRFHSAYDTGPRTGAGKDAVYVLTHVDVTPPQLPTLEPMLKTLAAASRLEKGAVWHDVLQTPSRKNHFTVAESWRSKAAFDTHALSEHARTYREKLGPLLGALYDQRLYRLVE